MPLKHLYLWERLKLTEGPEAPERAQTLKSILPNSPSGCNASRDTTTVCVWDTRQVWQGSRWRNFFRECVPTQWWHSAYLIGLQILQHVLWPVSAKPLKSGRLKGSVKCLEDPFTLTSSPTFPKLFKKSTFPSRRKAHQTVMLCFYSNHCLCDLQPPIHQSCHLGRVSHKAISVMTQISRWIGICINVMSHSEQTILGQINSIPCGF